MKLNLTITEGARSCHRSIPLAAIQSMASKERGNILAQEVAMLLHAFNAGLSKLDSSSVPEPESITASVNTIPIADLEQCARREVGVRTRVYGKWVSMGKMKASTAKREIECMEQIADLLAAIKAPCSTHTPQPDLLPPQ